MQNEPRWLTFEEVEAIHLDQLACYGGAPGTKDDGLVKGALAYPQNKWSYEQQDDLIELAAALCWAIAKSHGYVDGNKRVATVAMLAFLQVNGVTLNYADEALFQPLAGHVEKLAASEMSVEDFAGKIFQLVIPYP